MDTHAMHTRLVQSGLPDQQAEAIVEAVKGPRDNVVTIDKLESSQAKQTLVLTGIGIAIASASVTVLSLILGSGGG